MRTSRPMSTLPDAISHLLDSTLVSVLGGLPNLLEFILRRLCASVFKRLLKRDQPGLHLTADQRGVNLNCLSEGNPLKLWLNPRCAICLAASVVSSLCFSLASCNALM